MCKACQQVDHCAVDCNMLAMALCLKRYMKGHLLDAARDTIESKWANQWKEQYDNPCCKPRQVIRMYLDELDMTGTALDAQFDWTVGMLVWIQRTFLNDLTHLWLPWWLSPQTAPVSLLSNNLWPHR